MTRFQELTQHKTLQDMKSKERSKGWLAAASLKLQPAIKRLHKIIGRKSDVICKELFKLTDVLLRHCQRYNNCDLKMF